MLSLYRKYRPQNFREILAQDITKKTLQNAVRQNRIVHAYLFAGPRGTGKTTTARVLAKAINCLNSKDGEPCGKCEICQDFAKNRTLDLIEIDAASNRGIDEVRDLVEKIKFAPTRTKYKVFVIDEVHMLTKEAFNALLKTLEEPPAHAVFVLCTTEIHRVPATILSRCQRYDFRRIPATDLVKRLQDIAKKEKIKIETEAIRLIAEAADGSFRDAEGLLDQIVSYIGKEIKIDDIKSILGIIDSKVARDFVDLIHQKDARQALILINELQDEGYDLVQFCKNLVEYLRKVLIVKMQGISQDDWLEAPEVLEKAAKNLRRGEILQYIKAFLEAGREIKNSTLPQLPLELAVVDLVGDELREMKGEDKDRIRMDKDKKRINEEDKDKIGTKQEKSQGKVLEMEGLLKVWPKILAEVKKENHSLVALLENSIPQRIKQGKLIIATNFDFYKDKILESKNREKICKALKKITNCNLVLDCEIIKSKNQKEISFKKRIERKAKSEEEDLAKEVEEMFG